MKAITVREAMLKLRMGRSALYWQMRFGKDFPRPAKFGGKVVLDEDEVDAWMAAQFAKRDDAGSAPNDAGCAGRPRIDARPPGGRAVAPATSERALRASGAST